MKKLFCAVLLLFFVAVALCACAPAGPTITPPISVVEPAPAATAILNQNMDPAPASTFEPDDDLYESDAEPLSESDFLISLPEGDFDLLTQGCAELEAMTGLKFKSGELQTDRVLFTKLETYVESARFLNAPTPRGIKLGDSFEDMLEAYGTPAEINDSGDFVNYIFYVVHDEPETPMDFTSQRPLWYYAICFTVSEGKVESAFIADWVTA